MSHVRRSIVVLVPLVAAVAGGCGAGSSTPVVAASARHVAVRGNPAGKIVLTPAGAQRIGIATATALAVPAPPAPPPLVRFVRVGDQVVKRLVPRPAPASSGPSVTIPASAVVYDPGGATYAFTRLAPLTFTEVPIAIDHIDGSSAYLMKGPKPGTHVVIVGAEELYGVQTGVLAQT